ncbi:MAG: winged helix-turn-helix domain-containing protein [Agathobacter sp.]|uniref:BTAD domain-containing putative transcriptional regulator n=1 Tax=Agathobacter sp. TaxID=2021311 RepID=UPI0025866336|nr:BTAD domain-containing putative transcriptional regulator [Agathobacter sp.]MCR5678013.1 winged helix-turn-helix domain-containing protein [Agathobacter sp.]
MEKGNSGITISTFGGFQAVYDDIILNDKNLRSVMLSRLFMYMIIHRDKALSTDTIINSIWATDEEVDNPVGALKNLMYRLRKSLERIFGPNDYILTNRGSYQWNPEIPIVLDCEKFEQLINVAKKESVEDKALIKYEQAVGLYQGEFLPGIKDCYWAQSLNTYYQSMYLSVVKALGDLYKKTCQYEYLDRLVTTALSFDNADEQLYCYQIEARMRLNKISLALESYENAKEIIERELGVRKTTVLNKVYEELLAVSKSSANDIEEVHEDIVEENPEGVFFCSYPIFREIYHLEARKNARSDEDETMMLITMEGKKTDTKQIAEFRIKKAMATMESCIRDSLRVGDVASKYSDSQFILLLPSCNEDYAHLVGNRLISNLYAINEKHRNVVIKLDIRDVSIENELIENKKE